MLNIRYQHPIKYFTDATAQTSLFLVSGVFLKILNSSLAFPMFAIFGSMATATLAIKIINRYDLKSLIRIKISVLQLEKRYPKIRIIALIFTIAISLISSTVGCFVGAAFGIYSGIVSAAEYSKKIQAVTLEKQNELQRNQIILS